MLVLTRRKSEQLVLNGRIVVTVLEVRGKNVKLGIEAPREVPVHRKEVFQAISELPLPDDVIPANAEPARVRHHVAAPRRSVGGCPTKLTVREAALSNRANCHGARGAARTA
jgi:carbon storage regulator